jgi:hypothetical protein
MPQSNRLRIGLKQDLVERLNVPGKASRNAAKKGPSVLCEKFPPND